MKKIFILGLALVATLAVNARGVAVIRSNVPVSDSLLWDLQELSRAPQVQWLVDTGRVHSLLFQSVDYKGHPTHVFGYYSDPDLLMHRKQKGRYPAVLLLHGGAGRAFRQWVEKWAAEGYAALTLDLSGRDMDYQKLPDGGPDLENGNDVFAAAEQGNLRDVWTYHAVATAIKAHSLLLSLPHVDPQRTCLTGISWGGYLTCIAGSLDNRFHAAAPVYGCGFYTELQSAFTDMGMLSEAGKARWMRWFDPSHYLPYARIPFLFVSGNTDPAFYVHAYKKSYELIPQSLRTVCLRPGMQHGYCEGWEPHELRAYFESVVNGGCPLAKAYPVERDGKTIRATFDTPVAPEWALFYYTNDTDAPNAKRQWESIQMPEVRTGDRSVFTVSVPEEGYRIGFVVMRDTRGYLSTSGYFMND